MRSFFGTANRPNISNFRGFLTQYPGQQHHMLLATLMSSVRANVCVMVSFRVLSATVILSENSRVLDAKSRLNLAAKSANLA